MARYISVRFLHLTTDWFSLRQPELKDVALVLRSPQRGRMIITGVNAKAKTMGIEAGMSVADATAIFPDLKIVDDKSGLAKKLLAKLAHWCIRFTPAVAIDSDDGLILDVTGCAHLWGGEESYLRHITKKLNERGYEIRAAIADTQTTAWAVARFSQQVIVEETKNFEALRALPPAALRLESETIERLHKLGLHRLEQVMQLPRPALRKRFGNQLLSQIDKALGMEFETLDPVQPIEPYQERLPCLEPIVTATGIEIALKQLLTLLCLRLQKEQLGVRNLCFKGYRVDGKIVQAQISTYRPTHHIDHLFKLLALKLDTLEPDMGIELFTLDATKVEPHTPQQASAWQESGGLHDERVSELLDRLATRVSTHSIKRYVAAEHHWPEWSFREAGHDDTSATVWQSSTVRPVQMLSTPERIEVTAPIPDYPPMLFRYKGKLHEIVKADGPERIEQEWWLQQGQHRDYYRVEDEQGNRYWLFRLGHYHDTSYQWFIHGFFS